MKITWTMTIISSFFIQIWKKNLCTPKNISRVFFHTPPKSPSWKIWVSFAKTPIFWGVIHFNQFLPRVNLHSEVIELPGRCKSSRHGIRWAPGPKILGGKTCGAQKNPQEMMGHSFRKKRSQHHVSKLASFKKTPWDDMMINWLVVSTPLKNMSRIGNHLPQFSGWKFPKIFEKRPPPSDSSSIFTWWVPGSGMLKFQFLMN